MWNVVTRISSARNGHESWKKLWMWPVECFSKTRKYAFEIWKLLTRVRCCLQFIAGGKLVSFCRTESSSPIKFKVFKSPVYNRTKWNEMKFIAKYFFIVWCASYIEYSQRIAFKGVQNGCRGKWGNTLYSILFHSSFHILIKTFFFLYLFRKAYVETAWSLQSSELYFYTCCESLYKVQFGRVVHGVTLVEQSRHSNLIANHTNDGKITDNNKYRLIDLFWFSDYRI